MVCVQWPRKCRVACTIPWPASSGIWEVDLVASEPWLWPEILWEVTSRWNRMEGNKAITLASLAIALAIILASIHELIIITPVEV